MPKPKIDVEAQLDNMLGGNDDNKVNTPPPPTNDKIEAQKRADKEKDDGDGNSSIEDNNPENEEETGNEGEGNEGEGNEGEGNKEESEGTVGLKEVPEDLLDGGNKEDDGKEEDDEELNELLSVDGENLKGEQQVNWGKARKKLQAQADTIAKLKKSKDGGEDNETVQKLEKEIESLSNQLGQYSLNADPRFRKKYDDKQQVIGNRIMRILKDYEVENAEDVLKKAAGQGVRARHTYLEEVAPEAIVPLEQAYGNLDALFDEKQHAIEAHQETRKGMEQEGYAQLEKDKKLLHNRTMSQLNDGGFFLFKEVDGSDKWNEGVQALKKKHVEALGSSDPDMQSSLLAKGVAAEALMSLYVTERNARMDAEKKLGIDRGTGTNLKKKKGKRSKSSSKKPITAKEAAGNVMKNI